MHVCSQVQRDSIPQELQNSIESDRLRVVQQAAVQGTAAQGLSQGMLGQIAGIMGGGGVGAGRGGGAGKGSGGGSKPAGGRGSAPGARKPLIEELHDSGSASGGAAAEEEAATVSAADGRSMAGSRDATEKSPSAATAAVAVVTAAAAATPAADQRLSMAEEQAGTAGTKSWAQVGHVEGYAVRFKRS